MNNNQIVLSDEQKIIVEFTKGQQLVLAPPGTGKTELLAQRVNLALNRGIPSEEMICLTFTNRAANGMKERIEERHPNNSVFIGNIHHFCSNFLFKNQIIPHFTALLDEEDSELLLREAKSLANYDLEVFNPDLLRLNTTIKQQKMNFPQSILLPPDKPIPNFELAKQVCLRYEQLKEESSLLDFDDLLTLAYYHLANIKSDLIFTKYSWVQVDEVQDLNPIQWEIIKLVSTNNSHKVFFGDYEQAIFSFMGVKLERLHSIEKECNVYNLQKNFRSPSYLLQIYIDYAKAYLSPKWKKDPIPDKSFSPEKDSLVIVDVEGTNSDEANFIASNILPALLTKDKKQTAILIRWNKTADLFSNILKSKNVDHFKISGYDLFRRKIIKDIIAFLGCLENKYDRVSWFRLFNIFGKIPTLKDSRHFVNSVFNKGFLPQDFLSKKNASNFVLSEFLTIYKNERIVVFDTETTGLDTQNDDIIQIAGIELINGEIGNTFEVYINTNKDLSKTEHIHKISKSFLQKNGLRAEDALLKFNTFVNGDTLIAHNLSFDLDILKSNNSRYSIDSITRSSDKKYDSIDITRRIFPKLTSYKLVDLISSLKFEGSNTHNALDDVKATANLIKSLIPELEKIINTQQSFYEQNKKTIETFNDNFFDFWNDCKVNIDFEISLTKVIIDYVKYMEDTVNYKFENEDKYQLSKLLRHMDVKCGIKPLKAQLKTHIPEYKLSKESDLILGDERIVISTVHKAKGLEFENVIIPECVNDVYPSWATNKKLREARNENDKLQAISLLKEDARTLYVALSRAKKRLILTSHSISVNQYGRSFPRSRTKFVDSIENHFSVISA